MPGSTGAARHLRRRSRSLARDYVGSPVSWVAARPAARRPDVGVVGRHEHSRCRRDRGRDRRPRDGRSRGRAAGRHRRARTAGRGAASTRRPSARRPSAAVGSARSSGTSTRARTPSPGPPAPSTTRTAVLRRPTPTRPTLTTCRSGSTSVFDMTNLPSYRLAIDMRDLDGARIVITTGQSGNPFDRHYDDQIEPWRRRDRPAAVHAGCRRRGGGLDAHADAVTGPSGESRGDAADLVVVGAGVMGAWIALRAATGRLAHDAHRCLRGRPCAGTSGDETRIIRASHSDDPFYSRWSREALTAWNALAEAIGERFFVPAGVLWLAHEEGGWEASSEATLRSLDIPVERLSPADVAARWPQIALGRPRVRDLRARGRPADGPSRGGGRRPDVRRGRWPQFELGWAEPGAVDGRRLLDVIAERWRRAGRGRRSCSPPGPWLPRLFPDVVGDLIRVTKQDVLFVGLPAGRRPVRRGVAPLLARFRRGGLRPPGGRRARHEGRARPLRSGLRPDRRRADRRPGERRARARATGPALPGPGRRAGRRDAGLPVRDDARTASSSSTATRTSTTSGSSAAAPATASSTAGHRELRRRAHQRRGGRAWRGTLPPRPRPRDPTDNPRTGSFATARAETRASRAREVLEQVRCANGERTVDVREDASPPRSSARSIRRASG